MAVMTVTQILAKYLHVIGLALFIAVFLYAYHLRRRRLNKGLSRLVAPTKKHRQEPVSLHPHIEPLKCIGCGNCVKACPEGEIIQLINNKAQLIETKKCIGHGECALRCPSQAITMVVGSSTIPAMVPRRGVGNETNISGLYIAGDITGRVLIHSAMKQGVAAAEHALTRLTKDPTVKYDLLIVGAGPAGIAAALKAKDMGANYLCIDQGKRGGSICHYAPLQKVKVVELHLPLIGTLAFPKEGVEKSELIAVVNKICDSMALRITEQMGMEELKSCHGGFAVNTTRGTLSAAKVIIATGVAAMKRKFAVTTDDPSTVFYDLEDIQQFVGRNLAVYGGGNCALSVTYRNTICHRCNHTAIAAAIALCQRSLGNRVTLILNNKQLGGCAMDALPRLAYLVKQRRLQVLLDSRVLEKKAHAIMVQHGEVTREIKNDMVFIFNGVMPPQKFLKELGIEIDKKYAEPIDL